MASISVVRNSGSVAGVCGTLCFWAKDRVLSGLRPQTDWRVALGTAVRP